MKTNPDLATSYNCDVTSRWLSLALAALLALPSAAFATPWGADSARSLSAAGSATPAQPGLVYQVNMTGDAAGLPPISRCDTDIFTSGDQCTLRAALQATNSVSGEDTITFNIPASDPGCDSATGRCVINLTQGLPDVTESVNITGPGADVLTVRRDTGGDYVVFNVTTAETVSLSGLTISNGRGGISNLQGTLMISNSVISGNSGAGIGNSGTLTITNSTISDNSGSFFGGGISNSGTMTIANSTIARNLCFEKGGGIYNLGDPFDPFNPSVMRIINSTLFRNVVTNPSVGGGGGGIFNESATLMVTNSTISRNIVIGGSGVGIVTNDPGPVNSVSVKSSIIAANFQSQPDVIGPFTSAGFNLIGNADGSTGFTHPTDQTGTDASPLNPGFETDIFGLPLLKDNGGPTHTIALLSTSPAIDKGSADGLTGTLTTDQRGPGFPRSLDYPSIPPATGGDNTDIGAFELPPPPINPVNAHLINESCPPANGAIDPGERVTVNLELMNTSNAATSNLVATLQSSGGVLAPSGPQSYGAIAVNSTAARDFSFTVPGNVSSGQTITATLQLQDGANNLGTVSFNFTAGPAPCSFIRLVVTSSLSCANASTVVGAITVQNIGSLAANNVTLTTARLGGTNGTPLPQSLGNLALGESATVMVNFSNSTPGASSMLTVGGTYSGGSFSSNKRVIIPACSPGAPGCGWKNGDMVTYNQDNWGGDPSTNPAAALVSAQFDTVYSAFGGLEVGITGAAGYSMLFTSASALLAYEPASGGAATLNSDLIDPTSSASGVFGGFVVALQLNVDFSDANLISGTSGLRFGDLRICGLTAYPLLNGMTVREFLATANQALGGGSNPYTPDDIAVVAQDLSAAFEGGSVSLFAQQHLVSGPACP